MRRRATILTAALVLGLVPAAATAQEAASEVPTGDLYVQTARSGSMVMDADGQLALTLDEVDPRVVFFSERPARNAGTLSNQAMIDAIFGSGSSPNAALVVEDAGAGGVLPLELSAPLMTDGSITYQASLLDALPDAFAYYQVLAGDVPAVFGEVALLLDAGSAAYSIAPFAMRVITPTSWPATITNEGQGAVEGQISGSAHTTIIKPGNSHKFSGSGSDQITITNSSTTSVTVLLT